jgi:hypothetical protein
MQVLEAFVPKTTRDLNAHNKSIVSTLKDPTKTLVPSFEQMTNQRKRS